MNAFDRLKRSVGSVPWGAFTSIFAQNLGVSTDAAAEVIEQLKEWGAHLTKNALLKWTMSVAQPTRCESPDVSTGHPKKCPSYAVVRCDVCGRPCCLAHARVDYLGDGICEVCIGEAKARARGQAVPTSVKGMTVPEALLALKLPRMATWDEIKKRYRKLVVQYNADKPQSDKQREKNTARLKKINEAFAVLRGHFEKKEAA